MTDTPRRNDPPAGGERTPREQRGRRWRRWLQPGPVVLAVACAVTLGAKLAVTVRRDNIRIMRELFEAWPCDLAFFAACAAIGAIMHLLLPVGLARRVNLAGATITLAWSGLNAAWLVASGVQLQPGVLGVLARQPVAFWPMVRTHLVARPVFGVTFAAIGIASLAWIALGFVKPARRRASPRRQAVTAAAAAIAAATALGAHGLSQRAGVTAYSGQIIAFSSHWYALVNLLRDATPRTDVDRPTRRMARAGERAITPPPQDHPRSNVFIILLESVSLEATGFVCPDVATPHLAALAGEGVMFDNTRAPLPLTSKAWWATLTGTIPDVQPDNAETVLADEPYESLATVLAGQGYRSAFFQMARGSFECAPGMFANLDFDWAWFRENLEDESAHLGYMNGDDYRLIEPMFDWIERETDPFLLVTITSVTHDPYVLPAWCGVPPAPTEYARYLQTIEYTDGFLARVLDELDQRGLAEETLVCVIGDHGQGFRPESGTGRYVPFEEVLRVPWLIRFPGRVEPGARFTWPCSQLDVTPTILSLLGYDISDAGFDGVNAMEPQPSERELFFSSWYRNAPFGVVRGDRKLVYWPYTDKLYEYDLARDPGEVAPVQVEDPEKTRVVERLEEWRDSTRIHIDARRFRQRVLYDHWPTLSDGRFAQAYYVSEPPAGAER